jgi:predicted RNase H-like HicB family nuclease
MTKNYLVVFAKCKGSNFSGYAPDVPGCVSAGDTLAEMEAMMREALESHLQLLAEDGDPIPEPSCARVDFLPEDFEDTEYFVVEKLAIMFPAASNAVSTTHAA